MDPAKGIFFYVVLLFLPYQTLFGQSHVLSGQVVEEEGRPVFGAMVLLSKPGMENSDGIQEPFAQAVTNIRGRFTINSPGTDGICLTVKHLGFATEKRTIHKREQQVNIKLSPEPLPMKEVVISSLKNRQTYDETSIPVEALYSEQWSGWMPRDLTEVLDNVPGVTKSSDGLWANGVQIRGFGQDRYVSLVDGNRIETATDLSGALSTIDMSDVERVEVIKSGLSSLYGSGALGGVINVITKQAYYNSKPYLRGTVSTEYHSVNHMFSPRGTVFTGGKAWNAKIHFGHRNAGDAMSPEGQIQNSRFTDWSVSGSFAVRTFEKHEFSLDYQKYDGEAGIPGGAVLPENSQSTYLDFDRDLIALQYHVADIFPSLKSVRAKLYRQEIYRNVEILPNVPAKSGTYKRVTPVALNPSATHQTSGLQLESNWVFGNRQELIVGWDLWERGLESQRSRHLLQETLDPSGNTTSKVNLIRGELPLPASHFKSNGIFSQYNLKANPRLNLTLGGRLDWITLSNEESRDPDFLIVDGEFTDDPPGQIIVYPASSASSTTWAMHAGVAYQVGEFISLSSSYGRSYRAPSLEERYKYINLGHTVELGNPDLVPELGNFVDAGIKVNSSRIQLAGNFFLNYLSSMITMVPADSVSFSAPGESGSTTKMHARRYENIDKALLSGFEFNVDWWLYPAGVAYGQVSFVRGLDRNTGENLPQIAPLNGMVGIRHQVAELGKIELRARLFGSQNKVAEGELPSEGYVLADCFFESKPIRMQGIQLQLFAGVENFTNTSYQSHLSTNRGNWMLEPGINMKGKLSIQW